jgi:hypothetical protein
MSRDYASRTATRTASRSKARSSRPRKAGPGTGPRKRPAKSSASQERSIWSAPSFSAGVIFGATLVLLASYAPTVFEDTVAAARGPVTEPEDIVFEFEDILENGTVEVDPNAYEAQFPGENPDEPVPEYQVQAISVKSAADATKITRELIAMGLPARSERVDLSSGLWYRVMVGPYNSRREAERVINRLAERNMVPEIR